MRSIGDIITFLKSDEFGKIIKSCIDEETKKLHEEVRILKQEVKDLKDSNIELVKVLTNSNGIIKDKQNEILERNVSNQSYNLRNRETPNQNNFGSTIGGEKNKRQKNCPLKNNTRNPDVGTNLNRNNLNRNNIQGDNINNEEMVKSNEISSGSKESNKWEIQNRKYRRKNVIYGNSSEESSFKGVERFVDYHVFRCPLDLTKEELEKFLLSKGIPHAQCEEMQSKYPNVYKSFKASISSEYQKTFTNPEIWPKYVGIDQFQKRFFRKSISRTDGSNTNKE